MLLKWIFDRVVSLLGLLFLWPVLLECKDGKWEPLGEEDVMAVGVRKMKQTVSEYKSNYNR